MPRSKSKSRKSPGNGSSTTQESYDTDDYGLEEEQVTKKNTAKSKKRELESQYGTSSAILNASNRSPDKSHRSGSSSKKKKHGKIGMAETGEESFELLELVKQRPKHTKKPAHKKSSSKRKSSHTTSSHHHEQSFAVDDLVVQPSRSRPKPPRPSKSESVRGTSGSGISRNNSAYFNSSSHHARPTLSRGRSANRSNARSMSRSLSQSRHSRSLSRGASQRGRSLDRSASARRGVRPEYQTQLSMKQSQHSWRPGLSSHGSRHGSMHGSMVLYDGNGSAVIIAPAMKRTKSKGGTSMRRFIPKDDEEEAPKRSIVLIWVIVAAELGFDLGTTIIAFQAFLEEDSCCGNPITLGSIPVGSTIPFFLLVVAELAFLVRAITLTVWPSMLVGGDDDDTEDLEDPGSNKKKRSAFSRYCCCILRFKIRVLLKIINFLVLLNPFFGCIIAWMLMYQSDKTEAFIVLGLEAGSLILHFVSVWLEGSFSTWKERCIHCIPLIPFFVSIGLVLYYLKQGGVCYLVDQRIFKFTGCEICNITGVLQPCPNGTSLFDGFTLDNLDTFDKIKDKVLDRTEQGTYCTAETSFCFYDYDDGQLPPVNGDNSTNVPTEEILATIVPEASPVDDNTEPPEPNEFENPSEPPVPEPTDPPETPSPTEAPVQTPSPTAAPVQEPDNGGGGGSDGFNMDEIGSDGFDPNDLFGGRKLN